jgi:hypothetical protein
MIPEGRTVECNIRKASIKSNLNKNMSDGTVGALETIAATLQKKSHTVSDSTGFYATSGSLHVCKFSGAHRFDGMSYGQASGDHGAAHLGGRKKLSIPVASPALPPDSDTLAPPTLGRSPQRSAAALRLARQAVGSAGKRRGLPAHPSRIAPPSMYDSRQGPASAAVAAVASAPGGGTLLYSTSLPQQRSVAEDSFGVQLSPSRTKDDGLSESDMTDFLAFNVLMSPVIAEVSGDCSTREGTGSSLSSSDGAVLSDAAETQTDSDTTSTEVQFSGVPKPRRRTRRSRPQSAPAAPNGRGAVALSAWDDVENRPSFEVSGLQVGVGR